MGSLDRNTLAVEELSGEPFGLIAGPAALIAALRPLVEA